MLLWNVCLDLLPPVAIKKHIRAGVMVIWIVVLLATQITPAWRAGWRWLPKQLPAAVPGKAMGDDLRTTPTSSVGDHGRVPGSWF